MPAKNRQRSVRAHLALGALLVVALLAGPSAVPPSRAAEQVGAAFSMKVSPDERYVVYSAPLPSAPGSYGLFSRALPQGQPVRLDQGASSAAPLFAISPDSQRVVYTQTLSGSELLASAAISGSEHLALGSIPAPYGAARALTFGADPRYALVASVATTSSSQLLAYYLLSLPLAGGGPVLLDQGEPVRISPDGSQVVYARSLNPPQSDPADLYRVPIAGGTPVKLGLPDGLPPRAMLARYTSWSAFSRDSSRLIFYLPNSIYSVALDGSPALRLNQDIAVTDPPMYIPPTFGQFTPFELVPGTDDLIFTAKETGLYRVPVGGGVPTAVPGTLERKALRFYQISPDGRWLVYVSGAAPYHLFRSALDSGDTADLGVPLSNDKYGYVLKITPDSSQAVVRSDSGDGWKFYSLPLAGGAPVYLSGGLQVYYATSAQISSDSRYALIDSRYLVPLQRGGAPFKLTDPSLDSRAVSQVTMAPASGSVVFTVSEANQPDTLFVGSLEPRYVFLPLLRR